MVICLERGANDLHMVQLMPPPFPQIDIIRALSNGDCLKGKRENYQVCSVQYCVQQLYTVNCPVRAPGP